jgi:hypothetical protein
MKLNLLFLIIVLLIKESSIYGQHELERNFPLTQFYNLEGNIKLEHVNDGIFNGFRKTRVQLQAPFFTSESQEFALHSVIQKKSIVDDQILTAQLGLAWQLTLAENLNLTAALGGLFYEHQTNKNSILSTYSDPLIQPQAYSSYGVSSSLGILHRYFWISVDYSQSFTTNKVFQTIEIQFLDASLGMRYLANNWEFRLPIQGFDLINFNQNQIYAGLMLAYKGNYIYGASNLSGNMSFELGLRPYNWLSIGFIYELNYVNSLPNYGLDFSYLWKSQKLDL